MDCNNNGQSPINQEKDQKKKLSRHFKGVWIPAEIWLMKDIAITEKALWAEIDSLYDETKGGCYASNDYLMEFTGLKIRGLQKVLSALKSKGLIEQVAFDGRVRTLKAIHPKDVAWQTRTKVHGSSEQKCTHRYKYSNNKESISKDIPKKDANASTLTSNSKEKLIERAKHIYTTESEHEKLANEYGVEIRDRCYEIISIWKIQTPRGSWKKVDYLSIKKWVVNAYYKEKEDEKKLKKFGQGESNVELANKIAKNFNPKIAKEKGIRIDVTRDAMLFVFTRSAMADKAVLFKENGFREQVDSLMRKYKLK